MPLFPSSKYQLKPNPRGERKQGIGKDETRHQEMGEIQITGALGVAIPDIVLREPIQGTGITASAGWSALQPVS